MKKTEAKKNEAATQAKKSVNRTVKNVPGKEKKTVQTSRKTVVAEVKEVKVKKSLEAKKSDPKEKPVKKTRPAKVKTPLSDIVENSQNTFKSTFDTLRNDIQKALPERFKYTLPTAFKLESDSIPFTLHLEIPEYTPTLYTVELLDVYITWNVTPTGKYSKTHPLKCTLI